MGDRVFSNSDITNRARALYDSRLGQWTSGTAHTLFIYDLILTSVEEYQYIWKARWSIGKILYILVRYPFNTVLLILTIYLNYAPRSQITVLFCRGLISWQTIGSWMQFTITQVIMGFRTAALYNLNVRIIALLIILGLISSSTILAIDSRYLIRASYAITRPGQSAARCFGGCQDCVRLRKFIFLPMMIFDAVVFFLTLFKHYQHSKRLTYLKTPLLTILYRDGFIYFAVIFSSVLINFVTYQALRPSLVGLMTPPLRSILGIMCGRLLLNLRGAVLRPPFGSSTVGFCGNLSPPSNYMHTDVSTGVGVWKMADNPNDDSMDLNTRYPDDEERPSTTTP